MLLGHRRGPPSPGPTSQCLHPARGVGRQGPRVLRIMRWARLTPGEKQDTPATFQVTRSEAGVRSKARREAGLEGQRKAPGRPSSRPPPLLQQEDESAPLRASLAPSHLNAQAPREAGTTAPSLQMTRLRPGRGLLTCCWGRREDQNPDWAISIATASVLSRELLSEASTTDRRKRKAMMLVILVYL